MNPVTAERPATHGQNGSLHQPVPADHGAAGITLNVEALCWGLVLAAAAALRLLDLGGLPLGPAEGPRAWAALKLAGGVVTPEWGGDLGSALAALAFRLFGDTALLARLPSALLGVLAVALIALYRGVVGRPAALVAALLLALSPVAVWTARTLTPEAAALPFAVALPPLAGWVFLDGRIGRAPLLTLVAGLGLGTGALVPATVIVAAVWLAVESAWLGGSAAARATEALRRAPSLLVCSLLAGLFGIALAVIRYGAGTERFTLAATRAWNGPAALMRGDETWSYVSAVLLAYEPLTLALALAGFVFVPRGGLRTPGARLVVIWAVTGSLLAVAWLHRDPGQLLVAVVPLALLGGLLTVRCAAAVPVALRGYGWLALLPLLPALGYSAVIAGRWANKNAVFTDELISVVLFLGGATVALIGGMKLARRPLRGALLPVAWVLLGAATLHSATSIAFRGGSEILTGVRTLPQADGVVSRLNLVAAPDVPVQVERRLWPYLAWSVRARATDRFVQTPPLIPAVIFLPPDGGTDATAARSSIAVGERWRPKPPPLAGLVRWWLFRVPWNRSEQVRALVEG